MPESSTEIQVMWLSGSSVAPQMAFAISRARSGSKPSYEPLAVRAEYGALASRTPTRILPFVWSAYS